MFRLKLLFIILIFVSLNFVSAVRINEVEENPLQDFNEWVELYNDGDNDIDISGWKIWEGVCGSSGPRIIETVLDGTIIQKKEFYIVEWSQSKLNNDGDFIILYNFEGNKIDETPTLKETSRGSKTWQFCNEEWIFEEQTKNSKNNCPISTEPDDSVSNNSEIDYELDIITNQSTEPIELQRINLNPQVIKSEDDNENLSKSNYAIYGLVFFCVLLVVLFILRKNKYNKNEFRWGKS